MACGSKLKIKGERLKVKGLKTTKIFFIFFICFFLFNFSPLTFNFSFFCFADDVKLPNVAGAFYPADKDGLKRLIDRFLDDVREDVSFQGAPKVLISPHAGFIYSGPVAAAGFRALKGEAFETVVILAASHHFSFHGAAVYPHGSFRTPIGDVSIDEALAESFIRGGEGLVFPKKEYFEKEHSLETQLPFLQAVLKPGFKIVPVVMGDVGFEDCKSLARVLAEAVKMRSILVVASTDLSHYKTYDEALALDEASVRFMKDFDARGLWDEVANGGGNVCGVRPVVTALFYSKEISADQAKVFKYANSGDTAGDKNRVVGYASILITKTEESGTSGKMANGANPMLTDSDKKRLLEIARQTVTAAAAGKEAPSLLESAPGLNLKRGVFVTLREHGALRGCVGLFASEDPLYQAVSQMAAEAALHDYRFKPVTSKEVLEISLEISVLTQAKEIEDWRKIRLGVDGVIVRSGFSSGVFLPQVATETGWDLETFLGELCSQKAGLDRECYKTPKAKIFTFQADIFSEEDVI